MIQANVKVERITTKKLDNVLSSQKSFSDKTALDYTGEGSSSVEPRREMKFVLAKDVEKPRLRYLSLRRTLSQNQRQKENHCLRVKGDLKWSILATIVAFKGTQDQISSSFTLLKGLILCMLKEMQEECQEESKLREKTMVNSLEMSWKFLRTSHHA